MRTGMAAFQSMHHDTQGTKIDVVGPQQPDLARAQTVTVGEQEQRPIARVRVRGGKQPGELSRVRKRIVSVGERGMAPAYAGR